MKLSNVADPLHAVLQKLDQSFDRLARNPHLLAAGASAMNMNSRYRAEDTSLRRGTSNSLRLLEKINRPLEKTSRLFEATPHQTIFREGSLKLEFYTSWESPARGQVVIFPSLINRPYILDLGRGRSLIQALVKSGLEVAVFDWGGTAESDRDLGLETLLTGRVPRALKSLAAFSKVENPETKPRALLGHCLGGNLALLFAERYPREFDRLVLLTTPIDTSNDALLNTWFQTPNWDPELFAQSFDRSHGAVPWTVLQASFLLQRPTLTPRRWLQFISRMSERDFRDSWLQMEVWSNDCISFSSELFRDLLIPMYRDNSMNRQFECQLPVFSIAAVDDHIVPLKSTRALSNALPLSHLTTHEVRGGHIGAVLSGKTRAQVWPELMSYLMKDFCAPLHATLSQQGVLTTPLVF